MKSTSSENTVTVDLVEHARKYLIPLNNSWSRKRKNAHRRTQCRIVSIATTISDMLVDEVLKPQEMEHVEQ